MISAKRGNAFNDRTRQQHNRSNIHILFKITNYNFDVQRDAGEYTNKEGVPGQLMTKKSVI
jgi:hypothetical protein